MNDDDNFRQLEKGIKLDVDLRDNYGGYLRLDQILSAQVPLSSPPHHDEMLFIIQHQVSELWLKLIVHEIKAAIADIQSKNLDRASKILARVKQIQKQLFEQWSVLETLTPSEYVQFRNVFGSASGFQSIQYRMVEFLLGNKNQDMLKMFPEDSDSFRDLRQVLAQPSIYDAFLQHLSESGYAIPEECLNRDWQRPHVFNEQLVDVEQSFQMWRFRHMKTVERIIGFKKGSGGSSGVAFLKKALDLTFFPELLDVRTHL